MQVAKETVVRLLRVAGRHAERFHDPHVHDLTPKALECDEQWSFVKKSRSVEGARRMDWKTLLAYITGTVDHELLLRNEYLVTENRLLRQQFTGRVRLTDAQRKTLAEIGHKLGKRALAEVATLVKPNTILSTAY